MTTRSEALHTALTVALWGEDNTDAHLTAQRLLPVVEKVLEAWPADPPAHIAGGQRIISNQDGLSIMPEEEGIVWKSRDGMLIYWDVDHQSFTVSSADGEHTAHWPPHSLHKALPSSQYPLVSEA